MNGVRARRLTHPTHPTGSAMSTPSRPFDHPLPAGAWPVALTPFGPDRELDLSAYRDLLRRYADAGSAGVFATCLSSEIADLTANEIVILSRFAVSELEGRIPVVSGAVADLPLAGLIDLVRRVYDTGPAAVVLAAGTLCPGDADDTVWRRACEKLMDATPGIPLGIYECPWPNHRRLPVDTMAWLADSGRFHFHKDTVCNAAAVRAKAAAVAGSPLRFYDAHLPTLFDSMQAGGAGFSGVACNFFPELLAHACTLYADGRRDPEIDALLEELGRLIPPGYPANAKAFLGDTRGWKIGLTCRAVAETDRDNLAALASLAERVEATLGRRTAASAS